jgi:hypothetical protein
MFAKRAIPALLGKPTTHSCRPTGCRPKVGFHLKIKVCCSLSTDHDLNLFK